MSTIPAPAHPDQLQDKGPAFLAVALVFTIIAFFFVLTRVYVRTCLVRAFGWDDAMVIFSMVRQQPSQ